MKFFDFWAFQKLRKFYHITKSSFKCFSGHFMLPTLYYRFLNLLWVVETTTLKTELHSVSIVIKFVSPSIGPLCWLIKSTGLENFSWELNQTLESLNWMTWWNLLFIGWDKASKKNCWKFHLELKNLFLSNIMKEYKWTSCLYMIKDGKKQRLYAEAKMLNRFVGRRIQRDVQNRLMQSALLWLWL